MTHPTGSPSIVRVGIAGASGYLGSEILRLLANHPRVEVATVTSTTQAGATVADVLPQFAGVYDTLRFTPTEAASVTGLDAVFLSTPHGAAAKLVPGIRAVNPTAKIIDLSQDHRIGQDGWVYGLPELFRADVAGASLVANPGCYPTASALAVAPLFKLGLAKPGTVIVDAKSGVSGAGRDAKPALHYPEMNESLRAYSVAGKHRHTPEIAQTYTRVAGAPVKVLFTPHIVPMNRGILAACYVEANGPLATQEELDALYRKTYADEAWVRVRSEEPDTKHVRGTNFCDVRCYPVPETHMYLAFAAIDNLVKGGSGQAVQNLNALFGIPETLGLPRAGGAP